jgi:hypothetical protein
MWQHSKEVAMPRKAPILHCTDEDMKASTILSKVGDGHDFMLLVLMGAGYSIREAIKCMKS